MAERVTQHITYDGTKRCAKRICGMLRDIRVQGEPIASYTTEDGNPVPIDLEVWPTNSEAELIKPGMTVSRRGRKVWVA